MLLKTVNKNKRIAFLFVMTFVFITIFACVPVSAAERPNPAKDFNIEKYDEYAKDELDGFKYAVYTLRKSSFISQIEALRPIFQTTFYDNGSGDVTTLRSNILDAVGVIGKMLCFIFFLFDLMEHATRETFTAEALVKSFAKLMILFVLFDGKTLDIISNFANALNTEIFNSISEGTSKTQYQDILDLIDKLKSASMWKTISMFFDLGEAGAGLTALVSTICVVLVGVGRVIEINLYTALLPLGIVSIYNGGVNSPGFRYVKKMIALYVQGAIMYAAFVFGSYTTYIMGNSSVLLSKTGLSLIVDLGFSLATAAVIIKSRRISEDVMGV